MNNMKKLMKNFQRFLSVTVIIGFFLPWIEFTGDMDQMKGALNEMWDVMGEFAEQHPQYQEVEEQMKLMNKMDGASGFDLATTKFGSVGDSPTLFMVPILALFAGIYNKKKLFIIYPILGGFFLLINAISGPVSMGFGLTITYGSLWIVFLCALGDIGIAVAKRQSSQSGNDADSIVDLREDDKEVDGEGSNNNRKGEDDGGDWVSGGF